MTTLQFVDTHNLVAFLAKPAESEGFEQVVDFLNASSIRYALTVNPTIYTSCIEQFWATIKVKTVNGEQQLQALVESLGMKIVWIGRNADIKNEGSKQRSRRPKRKDTEIPQSSVPSDNVADEAVNEEMDDSLVRATTTATGLDAEQDKASLGDQEDAFKQGRKIDDIDKDANITLVDETQGRHDDDIMFDMSDLADEEVFVAEQGVHDSKKDDVAQVNTAATTVSTASTIPVSTASKTDVEITLAQALAELKSAKPTTTASTRPKAKGLVIYEQEQASTTIVSSQQPSQAKIQDKGKAKMIEPKPVKPIKKKDQIRLDKELAFKLHAEEEEEARLAREKAEKEQEANVALIEEWNDIQAKIKADQLLAKRLQAREQEELTIEEKAKLFQQLLEKRRKHFAAKRAEEKRNKPLTKA
ncbi:hypothetical protein Tco_0455118 [Tanacetum coccineum]